MVRDRLHHRVEVLGYVQMRQNIGETPQSQCMYFSAALPFGLSYMPNGVAHQFERYAACFLILVSSQG